MHALENFRLNLRAALEFIGHTQDWLAIETGLSRPYINRLLQGKHDPTLPTCEKISDVLHVSLASMLGEPRDFQKTLKKSQMPIAS